MKIFEEDWHGTNAIRQLSQKTPAKNKLKPLNLARCYSCHYDSCSALIKARIPTSWWFHLLGMEITAQLHSWDVTIKTNAYKRLFFMFLACKCEQPAWSIHARNVNSGSGLHLCPLAQSNAKLQVINPELKAAKEPVFGQRNLSCWLG